MKYLRDLGRREDIQRFLGGLYEMDKNDSIKGVSLAYDWYWLEAAAWRLFVRPGIPFFGPYIARSLLHPDEYDKYFSELLSGYRPPDWDRHCLRQGYPKGARPIVIKCLLGGSGDEFLKQEPPNDYEGIPVRYEFRNECRAYRTVQSGDSIGKLSPATQGTAGGFLLDQSSKDVMLVSCAHVLGSTGDVYTPSILDSSSPSSIGYVVKASSLTPRAANQKCNNRGLPNAPAVDLALAAMYSGFPEDPRGGVDRMVPTVEMTQGDRVIFHGSRSKHAEARIAEVNLWREISVNDKPHCFGDLFVIEPRQRVYVNLDLAKPGDSGAWIMGENEQGARSWYGMLIAGEGARVYCSFAENIMDECDRMLGHGVATLY